MQPEKQQNALLHIYGSAPASSTANTLLML